jgi:hypothetical protein
MEGTLPGAPVPVHARARVTTTGRWSDPDRGATLASTTDSDGVINT